MSNSLKDFSIELKNVMANCRYCLNDKPITVDLAKNIQEISRTMLKKFGTLQTANAFKDDCSRDIETLGKTLMDFHKSAKSLHAGIEDMNLIFLECGI